MPVSICLQSQTVKEPFAHSQAGIPNGVQNRRLQRVGKFDYILGAIFPHFSSALTEEKDLPTLESYGSHFLHFVLLRKLNGQQFVEHKNRDKKEKSTEPVLSENFLNTL